MSILWLPALAWATSLATIQGGLYYKRTIAITYPEYFLFYSVNEFNNSQATNELECGLLTNILRGADPNPLDQIRPNSFLFVHGTSICRPGVVPFFSGDYDDKDPIGERNAIHVVQDAMFKRSLLLTDFFLFAPLHDDTRRVLFQANRNKLVYYFTPASNQTLLDYIIPSPIQASSLAVTLKEQELIVSSRLSTVSLESFSLFVWYHGNKQNVLTRPIMGIFNETIWNTGAYLYVGKAGHGEGKLGLRVFPSLPSLPLGQDVFTDFVVPDDTWTHVGSTYDQTTGLAKFYANGTVIGTAIGVGIFSFAPVARVAFGGYSTTDFCQCALDGGELYLRAIAQEEAQLVFNRSYPSNYN